MSILVHKVGINKTLGQKSDYANSSWRDSLVGEFLASSGLSGGGSDIWANSIGGQNDLRVFNGLIMNSSSIPYHASFDGNDDYIWNTSTGYGGNPFTVDLSADFTIGQWVRVALGNYAGTVCVMTGSFGGFLASDIGSDGKWNVSASGTFGASTKGGSSVTNNKWFYLSMSHDRSESRVDMYIDGAFHVSFTPVYTSGNWDGAKNLGFGHSIRNNPFNITSNSSLEVAKIYVWNRYWAASQHRHVFFGQAASNSGIHDINPHFGPTRTTT